MSATLDGDLVVRTIKVKSMLLNEKMCRISVIYNKKSYGLYMKLWLTSYICEVYLDDSIMKLVLPEAEGILRGKKKMRRSQPLDLNKEQLVKLGIVEETEEQRTAGRQVVKVESVDDMFDFDFKPATTDKILRPFRRMKIWIADIKRSIKNYFAWRKLLAEYYPWNIHAFLPMFIKHLELYIECENKHGIATQECKTYKTSTAQEAVDILKKLLADDYASAYINAIEKKWGKFHYEKTTYANGSIGFNHMTPEGYNEEMREAYEKANADEEKDLKRLGEIIERNMLDWWD